MRATSVHGDAIPDASIRKLDVPRGSIESVSGGNQFWNVIGSSEIDKPIRATNIGRELYGL